MNTTLKFGLIGGTLLALTIFFYFFDVTNSFFFTLWTIAQVAILIFSIYLGVKEEKRKRGNVIQYRDAIFTGLKINFIMAVIHSVCMFLFFYYQPAEIEKLKRTNIEQALKDMKELKFEESVIKDHIKFINEQITPFNQAKTNFMIVLVLGLVFSLIITAILRTKDPEAEAAASKQ